MRSVSTHPQTSEANPLLKNVGLVYVVALIQFASSLLSNLVVPAVATKADYADYRLVVLYAGYAGLLHFGLLNGFYLEIVGKDIRHIEYRLIRSVRRALVVLQMSVFAVAVVLLVWIHPVDIRREVLLVVILSWGLANWITFYNYLFQSTDQFRQYTVINSASSLVGILLLSAIVLARATQSPNLPLAFLVPLAVTSILYEILWLTRTRSQLQHTETVKTKETNSLSASLPKLWRRGLVLYLANAGVVLMFSLGGLFVSLLFLPTEFADYAFAYGFASISYIAFDGLMVALTPYIAQSQGSINRERASVFASVVLIWLTPLVFWIGCQVIDGWLPKYAAATPLLRLFSASLPLSAIIRARVVSAATANRREDVLLRFAIISVCVTAMCIGGTYLLSHTISGVALGWVLGIAFAGIFGNLYVDRQLRRGDILGIGLVLNALLASLVFIGLSHLGQSIGYGVLFTGAAIVALGINWLRLYSQRKPLTGLTP